MFATTTEDLVGNPLADALRVLREEGKSNLELAMMYKDEGNQLLKKGDDNEALSKYDYALSFLIKNENDISKNEISILKSQILSNKSLIQLNKKNYKLAIQFAQESIDDWKQNMKAHYRKCRALLLLRNYEECLKCYRDCQTIEDISSSPDFIKLKKGCELGIRKEIRLQNEKLENISKLQENWKSIWNTITDINHYINSTHNNNSNNSISSLFQNPKIIVGYGMNEKVSQLKDAFPSFNFSENTGNWPILFLYPQHNQIDVIPDANIDLMLVEYLAQMFPELEDTSYNNIPWDIYNEYHVSKLVVYILLDNSPKITSMDEWLENCQEERHISGVDGTELATTASQRALNRQTSHKKSMLIKYKNASQYMQIHVGCKISQILCVENHVLSAAILNCIVYVDGNEAHNKFKQELKYNGCTDIKIYNPNNTITSYSLLK
jgi:hypothetical protein